jgi:hypothetical protein
MSAYDVRTTIIRTLSALTKKFYNQPFGNQLPDSHLVKVLPRICSASGNHLSQRRTTLSHFSRDLTLFYPDPSAAAILMTFALKEAVPRFVPPHFPPNRAVADTMQYIGATADDFHHMAKFTTQLWAAVAVDEASGITRSMMHDEDFYRMVPPAPGPSKLNFHRAYRYRPSTLSGLWEGILMVKHPSFLRFSPVFPVCLALDQPKKKQFHPCTHLIGSPIAPLRRRGLYLQLPSPMRPSRAHVLSPERSSPGSYGLLRWQRRGYATRLEYRSP